LGQQQQSNIIAAAPPAPTLASATSGPEPQKKLGTKKPTKAKGSAAMDEDAGVRLKIDCSRTTPAQFEAMVTFHEQPANFDIMAGAAATGKTVVAGTKLTKKHGNQLLANHVNKYCKSNWTWEIAKSR
ncbi:hypothetical protein HK101_001951, partial [Irineochytrium annulatum]